MLSCGWCSRVLRQQTRFEPHDSRDNGGTPGAHMACVRGYVENMRALRACGSRPSRCLHRGCCERWSSPRTTVDAAIRCWCVKLWQRMQKHELCTAILNLTCQLVHFVSGIWRGQLEGQVRQVALQFPRNKRWFGIACAKHSSCALTLAQTVTRRKQLILLQSSH